MELTFNTTRFESVKNASEGAAEVIAQSDTQQLAPQNSTMRVTEHVDGVGDDEFAVSAAAIAPENFSRDDALGRLVASAFNLPAPPMPEFK
jgi:streptomycin 6-kinase